MEDLLGIEVDYNDDGSIKLHQRKYIDKIVSRFLPDGPVYGAQRNGFCQGRCVHAQVGQRSEGDCRAL